MEYFQKLVSGGKSSASLWKVFNRCSLSFSATSFIVQASIKYNEYILFLPLIVQSKDCYLIEQVVRCIGQCIPNASEMHMQFAIMQYANMQHVRHMFMCFCFPASGASRLSLQPSLKCMKLYCTLMQSERVTFGIPP